jgi:hypothetical protein
MLPETKLGIPNIKAKTTSILIYGCERELRNKIWKQHKLDS